MGAIINGSMRTSADSASSEDESDGGEVAANSAAADGAAAAVPPVLFSPCLQRLCDEIARCDAEMAHEAALLGCSLRGMPEVRNLAAALRKGLTQQQQQQQKEEEEQQDPPSSNTYRKRSSAAATGTFKGEGALGLALEQCAARAEAKVAAARRALAEANGWLIPEEPETGASTASKLIPSSSQELSPGPLNKTSSDTAAALEVSALQVCFRVACLP